MKYLGLFLIAILSFITPKLALSLLSPNDPEGSNLLIVAILAVVIFALLLFVYLLVTKKDKSNK